jgi:ABC-type proline/glycine betaine transport system ATPase subunit
MRGGKVLKIGTPEEIVPELNPKEKEEMITD